MDATFAAADVVVAAKALCESSLIPIYIYIHVRSSCLSYFSDKKDCGTRHQYVGQRRTPGEVCARRSGGVGITHTRTPFKYPLGILYNRNGPRCERMCERVCRNLYRERERGGPAPLHAITLELQIVDVIY